MTDVNEQRNAIRAKLVGSTPEAESQKITVFGVEMEMRQPSLNDVLGKVIDGDIKEQVAYFVINYCYIPGTDVKIFEDADKPQILKWPFGKEFNKLQDVITNLMGFDLEAEAEEIKENPLVEHP